MKHLTLFVLLLIAALTVASCGLVATGDQAAERAAAEVARHANVKPVVEEHTAVLAALRARDPDAARAAMRAHLSAVLDGLLFATEEKALEDARRAVQAKRQRYTRAAG